MSMFLTRLFGQKKSADPDALRLFLARQTAFVTQKTVLDYCRVKAGRRERETFADLDFMAALIHCRWQVFGAAAADLAALVEAWLRPHAGGEEQRLADVIARLAAEAMDTAEPPEAERADLAAAKSAIPRHLATLQQAPPLPADRLSLLSEAPLLATLPIHPDQRRGETPAIRGALRFHVVSTQQEMERAFDAPALAAALLA
jgi:hypothetical protein